jgi:hypothetical protein
MEGKSRARRTLTVVGGILAFLAAVAVGLVLWVRAAEERGWKAMEARVGELKAQSAGRSFSRPVLRGTPVPGNAWDEYLQAGAKSRTLFVEFPLEKENPPRRSTVEVHLKGYESAIGHFREGVRRSELRNPIVSGRQFNLHALSRLIVHQSRLMVEDGKLRQAAELLTDLALFGSDLSRNAESNSEGAASVARTFALDELRTLIAEINLSKDCLEGLDRELAVLDVAAPDRVVILSNNTAALGAAILEHGESWMEAPWIGTNDPPKFDWRHLFSRRLLGVALFNRAEGWNRRAGEAARMPWPKAEEIHRAIQSESDGLPDIYSSHALSSHAWSGWMRALLAKIRLLRAGVRFKLTGEVLSLEDPFGDRLQHEVTDGRRLKVWSVGAFAIGETEKTSWRTSQEQGTHHLVLRVER